MIYLMVGIILLAMLFCLALGTFALSDDFALIDLVGISMIIFAILLLITVVILLVVYGLSQSGG